LNEKTAYWLEIADYDLETARAMLETGRYLYVGFMCHQVIEKTLKAAIASSEGLPPKIHRLRRLAELAGLYERMSEDQHHHLNILEPLNIEARYPSEKNRIGSELSADRCWSIVKQTQELCEWIKTML
jgi:HEPN domain-containing protein